MTKPIFQRGVGKTFTPARSNEDKEDYIEILNQIYHEKNFSSSNKFLEFICKEAIEYIRLREQNDGRLPMKQTQVNSTLDTVSTHPEPISVVPGLVQDHESALATDSDTVKKSAASEKPTGLSAAERAMQRLEKTKMK
ncbi:MAG: hypothetical protein ACE3L7_33695 [Candidatus Pristimantibacillus sp.]